MNPIFIGNNIFELGTLSATGTYAGYSVNNLLDRRNYTKWKAAAHGFNYITINHGGPNYTVNAVAIFGHNFYSNSAVVTLEYYHDPPGEWVEVGTFGITRNGATSLVFASVTDGDQWRIKISTSAGALPEFSVLMGGAKIEFPYPPDSPHSDFEESSIKESAVSKTGNLLGVLQRGLETSFSLKFSHLTRTWVDSNIVYSWYVSYGKTGMPFIYIPDFSYDDEGVYLVRTADEWRLSLPKTILTYYESLQIDLTGVR